MITLDVDMPVMNGLDTAQVLWRLRPDLRILFEMYIDAGVGKPVRHAEFVPLDVDAADSIVHEKMTLRRSGSGWLVR